MSREWEPGDVALRTAHTSDAYTMRSMAVLTCDADGHDVGLHWHHENGGWDLMECPPSFRPLAVIDPEDREQVERLSRYIAAAECGDGMAPLDAVQAALREFADPKPPKPAEPTGLGAVVECSDGRVFVVDHVYLRTPRWYGPIRPGEDAYGRPAWSDIPAVKVLSEGVQP